MNRYIRKIAFLLALMSACVGTMYAGGNQKNVEDFYRVSEFSADIGLSGNSFHIATVFGPTGLKGWLLRDNLIVREVETGSPADGKMLPADVISAVNGKKFDLDPLRILGEQIIASEKTGRLTFTVQRDRKQLEVMLKIKTYPALAKTWPFDCKKSDMLLANAARFLAKSQRPDGGFDTDTTIAYGMAGLTLLATDDPAYLHNVRNLIDWLDRADKVNDKDGTFGWGLGYGGVLISEYFLKTGDESVKKVMRAYGDRIVKTQDPRGGWTHGNPGGYGYVQGGLMNPAGAGNWLALELMAESSLVYQKSLSTARRYFMRFVDNGTLPYGDHFPEFNGTGNSKDAVTCLALHVKGEKSAAALFGRLVTDFPSSRNKGHTGGLLGFGWGMIAGNMNPHRPDYHRCLNHWNWLYHVGRRWDGGFHFPPSVTGGTYFYHGPVSNTGCVGMVYGVPRKSLRILGKGRSVFGTAPVSAAVKKGLKLYQELKFAELRALVKPKDEYAKQLLKAAAMKEEDIALSLKAAEAALADMNPLKARTTADALNRMCNGKIAAGKKIIAQCKAPKYVTILQAGNAFEKHRFLIYTEPQSRATIEKIAASDASGIYQSHAKKLVATPSDSSEWVQWNSVLFNRYWETKEKDPVAMRICKRLAFTKGSNWTSWFPNKWLRQNGYIKDEFTKEWTALLPTAASVSGKQDVPFAYHAIKGDDAHPESVWKTSAFDDSGWRTAPGPVTPDKNAELQPIRGAQYHFFRIRFKTEKTKFKTWKLYIRNKGHRPTAIVYLNGHCLAWVDQPRADYEPVDLPVRALKYLKKGENVLAIRTRRSDKGFDIGIYAQEDK